jgi:tRNA wybutosine-synthesizing protein 3
MFEHEKKDCLTRVDKSIKGSIDKSIIPLINLINSMPECFTTSSCSGRTILINRYGKNQKLDSKWIYITHSLPKYSDFIKAFHTDFKGELWFKFESFILHVKCKTFISAKKMLDFAMSAGLKHSGIIAVKKYFMVEIEGTDKIDSLIGINKPLVDGNYIKEIIKVAQKKFKKNKEKIERFYNLLKQ